MRRIHHRLSVSLVVAVTLLALGMAAPAAQAQAQCGVPIDVGIVNSGFEQPTVPANNGVNNPTITGWTVAGSVFLWGPGTTFASGSQFVVLGDVVSTSGSVSQTLTSVPAGSTITFTIISLSSGTIALGNDSQAVTGSDIEQTTHTVSFDVPDPAPASLDLTLSSGAIWAIDQISGTYEVPCGPVIPPGCLDAVNGVGPFAGAEIVYVADSGGDGGSGSQVFIGTAGDDWIGGGSGDDLICGGGGADTIEGGSGFDVLYGDDGDDWLGGGSKDDVLDGGAGWDTCDGGSGSNELVNCEA